MHFDGKDELEKILKQAGSGIAEAVANLSLFIHPEIVKTTNCRNLFRVIRNMDERGNIIEYADSIGRVMACDNTAPQDAFKWSVGGIKGKDIQFNHVYSLSTKVEYYTSLANIFVTPAFLAKLTDTSMEISNLLKYRVYDLYGFFPSDQQIPHKPEYYSKLKWREIPPPDFSAAQLENKFRKAMANKPKRRTTISCRDIGWLFSDFKPDLKI